MEKTRFKDVCVLRGGTWGNNYTDSFRAHYRLRASPDLRFSYQGFRCVSPEKGDASKRFVRIR